MKKFLVFIFAVFYLGLSCGFAFNMHSCMGEISSIDLYHAEKTKCGKCGMQNSNSCCKVKLTVVKITDNQQIYSSDIKVFSPLILVDNSIVKNVPNSFSHQNISSLTATSPPPDSGAFICVLNSIFTI